jgi:uncharacterized membrane protein
VADQFEKARGGQRGRWDRATPADRAAHGARIRQAWEAKSPEERQAARQKVSDAQKKRLGALTPEQRRANTAAAQAALPEHWDRHRVDKHVAAVLADAGKLTDDHIRQLQALLPLPPVVQPAGSTAEDTG